MENALRTANTVRFIDRCRGDMSLYAKWREDDPRDFQSVYRKGKPYGNKYLVMYLLANDLGRNRVGISVSKKVGNSIIRHHLTRLIRESYRLHEEQFQCGYDIVIIARTTAKDRSYHEIESALIHLGKLHHIYSDCN